MAKILVVDDNPDVLDALDLLLGLHDHQVVAVDNPHDALTAISRQNLDLVIQDMNFTQELTTGKEGKSLFQQIRIQNPNLPIILMTAWTQLETAIELVKAGAWDYLPKPWDDHKLLELIKQITADKPAPKAEQVKLIYQSPLMQQLIGKADKVAQADVNVLITGENGCGKEVLADYIHSHSDRADKPFIKTNIGAIPADLMEAELFGAEKGAFTGANSQRIGRFEAADNGTLFLDEIGNLSLVGQMKLLRVLQTGEFERLGSNTSIKTDVRVICATNADLPDLVARGEFREDLWFRLNVVELHLPELNRRGDDVLLLAEAFIGEGYSLDTSAKQAIKNYPWPGNVRELQNACQRAKVFAQSMTLSDSDFNLSHQHIEVDEESQVRQALENHNWVIKKAAESLGLSRQALYRRIEKYRISEPDQC